MRSTIEMILLLLALLLFMCIGAFYTGVGIGKDSAFLTIMGAIITLGSVVGLYHLDKERRKKISNRP